MIHKSLMSVKLGAVLKTARKARGLVVRQIAEPLGVTVSAVQQWEKGTTDPSTANLYKVAHLLQIDANAAMNGELVNIDTLGDLRTALQNTAAPLAEALSSVVPAPEAPRPLAQVGRNRDVPVLGIVVGGSGNDGDFAFNGQTHEYAPRPPALLGKSIIAVRVVNESMMPRYEEGDLLYVDITREARPGEDAIIELKSVENQSPAPAFIKRMISKSASSIRVLQYNPHGEIVYDRSTVRHIYRVIPRNEVFGV